MRAEGVGGLEGLLPWTPAGGSPWSCSFVITKKKLRSDLNVKGCQKRGRDKKGRKVLGFNCVRRIQRGRWRDMKGSRDNVIWQCAPVLACVYAECVPVRWQSLHLVHRPGCAEYEREEMGEWTGSLMCLCAEVNS